MMNNEHGKITVYKSPDNRHRTEYFLNKGLEGFCLAEETVKGTLVSEFSRSGRLIDQVHYNKRGPGEVLREHLASEIEIRKVDSYERVRVSTECTKCNNSIARELDLVDMSAVEKIPVVPIFRCTSCGQRFYSMSDEYLGSLVNKNMGLFEKDELEEKERDEKLFVNTLNEYIIRIFASKRISRLVVKE